MSQELMNHPNYPIYNLFYLGNYSSVVHQLNTQHSEDKNDSQILLYRAYLSLKKYNLILNEIKSSDIVELELIKLSAEYETSKDETKKQEIFNTVEAKANEGTHLLNPNLQLILARLAILQNKLDVALKAVQLHPRHLECVSYSIQILLKLNRLDLAQQLIEKTRSWAEDVPLMQLMEAWVGLATGGTKYQEALYIFEELGQQFNVESVKMLTSKAVCHIHLKQYEEAEECLLMALEKDANDAETLINLITVGNLMGKGKDAETRYLNQLKDINPHHPYLVQIEDKSNQFDQLAAQYSAKA